MNSLRSLLTSLHTIIIDLLAPPRCAACAVLLKERAILCIECKDRITPVISTTLMLTATKSMKAYAAGAYQEPLKTLILAKHRGDQTAGIFLGELMWHLTPINTIAFDYIVPIPLHWTRYAHRGFNQAEEMASVIARMSGKPVLHLLKRGKRTQYQSTLSAHDRTSNMSDAFILTTHDVAQYQGKTLLLVDDLMTTGATLQVAGRALLQLKPASLIVALGARAI